MKSKYHHHVLLILAASVTVVVMALYAYMYYAVDRSASRAILARDIAGVEKLNKDQERTLTELYDQTKTGRTQMIELFVHTNDIVSFIESIEAVESQTGGKVTISGIAADDLEGKPAGTIGGVQAAVEVRGSWAQVMKALSAVELLPYQISVDQVRLDTSSISPTNKNREWRLVFAIRAALMAPPVASN